MSINHGMIDVQIEEQYLSRDRTNKRAIRWQWCWWLEVGHFFYVGDRNSTLVTSIERWCPCKKKVDAGDQNVRHQHLKVVANTFRPQTKYCTIDRKDSMILAFGLAPITSIDFPIFDTWVMWLDKDYQYHTVHVRWLPNPHQDHAKIMESFLNIDYIP